MALEGLAALAERAGRAERGAMLLGAGEALRERSGTVLEAVERDLHVRTEHSLRVALGPEAFASACGRGRLLDLGQAVAAALAPFVSVPPPGPSQATSRRGPPAAG